MKIATSPILSKSIRLGGFLCGFLLGASLASADDAPTSFKFSFAPFKVAPGFTQVLSNAFTPELGYGFDLGTTPAPFGYGGDDALHSGHVTSDKPFYFSAAVPEGNYNVTVTLGDLNGESTNTVKVEAHRLMLEEVRTATGKFETRTFTVNTRTSKMYPPVPNNAPGRNEVTLSQFEQRPGGGLSWDDKLTFEFNNTRPCLCAIEITKADDAPTIFLAGDSTVTDQRSEPGASWGQMLPRFFKPGVAVANYAETGETLKSFITALRLDKILSQMKKGDYFLIQFGHNDGNATWPQTYAEASTTYKSYLKVYIAEARRRGATPVLISPMERQGGVNGNTLGGYPEAVRQVAEEEKVAFIDLHSISKTFYLALGPNVRSAFTDGTHHTKYGAYELAKCVVEGIKASKLDLAKFIADDVPPFDPAHPDPIDSLTLVPSPDK